jgi:hypothetical protein
MPTQRSQTVRLGQRGGYSRALVPRCSGIENRHAAQSAALRSVASVERGVIGPDTRLIGAESSELTHREANVSSPELGIFVINTRQYEILNRECGLGLQSFGYQSCGGTGAESSRSDATRASVS